MSEYIRKIISGGQTGADRAALDAAKELGIITGGHCPKGFMTEYGPDISLKEFGLKPTKTYDNRVRTKLNIKNSDGTVIFCRIDKSGNISEDGTALTLNHLIKTKKPFLINPGISDFVFWVRKNNIKILNVAGNRDSVYPQIYEITYKSLKRAIVRFRKYDENENKIMEKLSEDVSSICNDNTSGSVSLLNKLIKSLAVYSNQTKNEGKVLSEVIHKAAVCLAKGKNSNMVVLNNFIKELLIFCKNRKCKGGNIRDYLKNYKRKWKRKNDLLIRKILVEIDFRNKIVLLHSNSSSVINLMKILSEKKIYPDILQCKSGPENEGLIQAEIIKSKGLNVKIIDDEDFVKYPDIIDFAFLGCDAYDNNYFLNKKGSFNIAFKLKIRKKPVYVIADNRKYLNKFYLSKSDSDIFDLIPLKYVTKMFTN